MRRLLASILLACLVAASAAQTAGAVSRPGAKGGGVRTGHEPEQPAHVVKWQALRIAAADAVATGQARIRADGRVRLADGTFVDYALEGEDHIVTLLADFTDPTRGSIAEPDRSVNNSDYWVEHFNRRHYRHMLFKDGGGDYGMPSMRDYYLQQSSGRYAVTGQVSRWVHIDAPESEFGANDPGSGDGGDDLNGPVWRVVRAALRGTVGVDEGIDWSPSVVDVWDRYDCDGDGNFDESDGYVDHFQLIHAGMGEEVGGGAQGTDAIWSHRWYAGQEGLGSEGPGDCLLGGYRVPGTGLWVGDYTIEPEDGGVGVFAHEFAHDLGLPDMYETRGGDNNTSYWTIMSVGSYGADSADPFLGTKPTHFGAWEKLVLGFLDGNLAEMEPGEEGTVRLGPAEGATAGNSQALRVNLPDYQVVEPTFPVDGTDPFFYFSGTGDNIDPYQVQFLDAPLTADTTVAFRARYDIEQDWDYAYVLYSTDGFQTWDFAETSVSTDTDPNGQNFGNGITGTSVGWIDVTATLPAGTDGWGFEYWTDPFFNGQGFAVDSISINGGPLDTAEDPSRWIQGGFVVAENGTVTKTYFHYYMIESRSYKRNDTALCGAAHFLTFTWAERQCFADGVLVWYRNSRFADNDVSVHPGYGQILPVDAHPDVIYRPFKRSRAWSPTWQSWDATFGLSGHTITLHDRNRAGRTFGESYYAPPVSMFDDSVRGAYYRAKKAPQNSVITPGSGLQVTIVNVSPDGGTYILDVSWAA